VQAVHALKPADAANVPVEQLEQVIEDAESEYLPTKHEEQTVAEEAEYFPELQLPVTADNPVEAQ